MTTTNELTSNSLNPQITKRIFIGFLILIGVELLNQFLIFSGSALSNILSESNLNPKLWIGIYQQFIQAAIGIFLFKVLLNQSINNLGINFNNKKQSFYYFSLFTIVWISIIAIYLASMYLFVPQTWSELTNTPLPAIKDIINTLFFQAIFPGVGEEILFRGFMLSLLAKWVFPEYTQQKFILISLVALTSVYFGIAHIYFQVSPFKITHIDFLQIITALGCGTVYSLMFLKTKSLLAPILSHNFANTTVTIIGYLISRF
ncbi:MAG: hypothetical protein CVU42_00990 [Chloroflexi bacterium HGW-Chloroflexi-4]|jgi:membrane protease YdiL (CAAX protease family)|nr:MAG: hypothetical protein CVU42_00990 [Chloroflexi bacterium HGW-Chloroflexi-4]